METDVHAQIMRRLGNLAVLGQKQLPVNIRREEGADLGTHIIVEENHIHIVYFPGNTDQLNVPFCQLVVESGEFLRFLQQRRKRPQSW